WRSSTCPPVRLDRRESLQGAPRIARQRARPSREPRTRGLDRRRGGLPSSRSSAIGCRDPGARLESRFRDPVTTAKRAETSEPAADAGGRMLAVAALSVTSFAMALNIHVFAALGPFLEPALGIGERQLGLLIATPGLAGTAGALPLGPLVDRFGRRGPPPLGP